MRIFFRLVIILPKTTSPAGPRVAIFRTKPIDPDVVSFITYLKTMFMILDILCVEDDDCIIAGKAGVVDLIGLPYKYLKQFTPSLLHKSVTCIQSVYPTRLKELHFLNTPTFFKTVASLIKMFLNEKMKNRVSRVHKMCTYTNSMLPCSSFISTVTWEKCIKPFQLQFFLEIMVVKDLLVQR